MKKRNAFTLIELLAVIVILAVILVISIPRILDVIETSKKDSFKNSAQLIADTAEKKKVSDKLLGKDEEITCKDVAKINDEDYASCKITFDSDGIAKVSITGKGKFDGLKVCNATKNDVNIVTGECPVTLPAKATTYIEYLYNNEETRTSNGLKIDNTSDANIRYYGSNPNNYVRFNNELWRIIGVFGNNVKLVRSESLGSLSWDSSDSSINKGNGINQWGESTDVNGSYYEGADLQVYLNKMYYGGDTTVTCYDGYQNSTITCPTNTLDRTAKLLIDKHTWSLGAIEMSIEDTISFYNAERGTANGKTCTSGTYCNDSVIRTTKWTGYVALPYITDWAYASSESACETNIQTKDSSNLFVCKNNNWMQRSDWTWYLSPGVQSANANYVWTVSGNGNVANYIMFGAMSKFAYYGSNVAPSIYLKSSVLMKGGSGTSSDPYKLA